MSDKTRLKRIFCDILRKKSFLVEEDDLREFETEYSTLKSLSEKEKIRLVKLLGKQLIAKKYLSKHANLRCFHTIMATSESDTIYLIDVKEGKWFRYPFKSLKLPRFLFDDENPDKLPESFCGMFKYWILNKFPKGKQNVSGSESPNA